jgi:hypothetical protein
MHKAKNIEHENVFFYIKWNLLTLFFYSWQLIYYRERENWLLQPLTRSTYFQNIFHFLPMLN